MWESFNYVGCETIIPKTKKKKKKKKGVSLKIVQRRTINIPVGKKDKG